MKNNGNVRKRYRRGKRLRPCVLRLVFVIPLVVFALERAMFDFADLSFQDMESMKSAHRPIPPRLSLMEIVANGTTMNCPRGLHEVFSRSTGSTQHHRQGAHAQHSHFGSRDIPKIVHQTSISRCLTPTYASIAARWFFHDWSYYFHDDDAVDRLLHADFPEFPHLKVVVRHCLIYSQATTKTDLWRYLVLWVHGGVYASLDATPNNYTHTTLEHANDAFFLVDPKTQLLKHEFMAISPRHPLMYYAIQRALANIMRLSNIRSSLVTVSQQQQQQQSRTTIILRQAFADFICNGDASDATCKSIRSGTFHGVESRSIRVVGDSNMNIQPFTNSNPPGSEEAQQQKVSGMEKKTQQSCIRAILGG
jgi:hypothetical protein